MPPPTIEDALNSIKHPEVHEMARRLAAHGLGICVPHMHDDETGKMVPLPSGIVQVEGKDRTAAFVPRKEAERTGHNVIVSWRWNDKIEAVETVRHCYINEGENVCPVS